MFVRKKKYTKALEDIKRLNSYITKIEPFAEIGVQAAQEALRGYKWVNFNGVSPNSSRAMTFNLCVRAAEEEQGDVSAKVLAAFKKMHELTYYHFSSSLMQNKKNILPMLEKVTKISAHTGSLNKERP